jgi:hypothetical protein
MAYPFAKQGKSKDTRRVGVQNPKPKLTFDKVNKPKQVADEQTVQQEAG